VHGVEWVVAAEIEATLPGARNITMARRQLGFTLPELDPRVLNLRCADDAFLCVGQLDRVGLTKTDLPALARSIARLDWACALNAVSAIRASYTVALTGTPNSGAPVTSSAAASPWGPRTFDCVVSIEGKRSYNRFTAENAVGEALTGVLGARFLPRAPTGPTTDPTNGATTEHGAGSCAALAASQPDVTVRLFLRGTSATAALRVARRPLHRRAYKLATRPGTLHPPLAAALATIAGASGITVHDPFCGDGTLAIETALTWPTARVSAGDIDPVRVDNTRANAARAGVGIACCTADAADLLRTHPEVNLLLTNPPWDLAVTSWGKLRSSLDAFWSDTATVLHDSGRLCTVTDAAPNIPNVLRQHRYAVGLATRLRLAGRIVHISLAAAPQSDPPQLPSGLARWRHRAMLDNVITEHGF
jgi:hypothetical protein